MSAGLLSIAPIGTEFRNMPNQFVESAGAKGVVAVWPVDCDPRQAVVDLVGDIGELGHVVAFPLNQSRARPSYGLTILPNEPGVAESGTRAAYVTPPRNRAASVPTSRVAHPNMYVAGAPRMTLEPSCATARVSLPVTSPETSCHYYSARQSLLGSDHYQSSHVVDLRWHCS